MGLSTRKIFVANDFKSVYYYCKTFTLQQITVFKSEIAYNYLAIINCIAHEHLTLIYMLKITIQYGPDSVKN